MSFASLLQEAEMPPLFLLIYATAVVLSSFNNIFRLVLFFIFAESFQAKKGSFQFKEVYMLPPISVT